MDNETNSNQQTINIKHQVLRFKYDRNAYKLRQMDAIVKDNANTFIETALQEYELPIDKFDHSKTYQLIACRRGSFYNCYSDDFKLIFSLRFRKGDEKDELKVEVCSYDDMVGKYVNATGSIPEKIIKRMKLAGMFNDEYVNAMSPAYKQYIDEISSHAEHWKKYYTDKKQEVLDYIADKHPEIVAENYWIRTIKNKTKVICKQISRLAPGDIEVLNINKLEDGTFSETIINH